MTFDEYFELIQQSVADSGYDQLYPSLCVAGDELEMKVLTVDLSEFGEESVAKKWAAQFAAPDRTLFVAYRQGARNVAVIEIHGTEVVEKGSITVN